MGRILVILGIAFVILGLLWPWLSRLGLGRLPGDIVVRHEHFTFYFPLTTGILVSLALSLIFWLISR